MSVPVAPIPGLEQAIDKSQQARDGVAPVQPAWWERPLKQVLAVVVIGCGSALPFLSPTTDALAFKVCSVVVATGAGLGITSRGNPPK